MHTKLEIVLETEKEKTQRKEFVFNDTKVKLHYVYIFITTYWTFEHTNYNEIKGFSFHMHLSIFVWIFQKREGFCQLLQQMKNKHSDKAEPDMISLFVGTWNMGKCVVSTVFSVAPLIAPDQVSIWTAFTKLYTQSRNSHPCFS